MAKYVFTVVRKRAIYVAIGAAIAVALLVGVIFFFNRSNGGSRGGAIVANGLECAGIARKIFEKGGSAADAAISTLLCEGVASPQSTGLGGGFVMTIYSKEKNVVETLIAREVAPLAATENMFVDIPVTGGKAMATPGELKGYWELHQRYGKLKWSELFDPVIELCRKGHVVSPYLAKILHNSEKTIMASPTLVKLFVNAQTNDVVQAGDVVKRQKLADTLEILKMEGADSIYNNGTIAKLLVQDIQSVGGIVTIEDLMRYEVRWETPMSVSLRNNKTLYTIPLPGSGPLVTFIMNLLDDYLPSNQSTTAIQRIAEAMKFAYAKRSELGDYRFEDSILKVVQDLTDYNFAMEIRKKISDVSTHNDTEYYGAKFTSRDDHGTSHINIIAPNGDAIAATGTINTLFGSKIVSPQTGIILNDGMDDFAVPGKNNAYGVPPSPANFIKPRKMPLSSMCPSILLDENRDVSLVIGAAGGTKITSSVAYVLLRYLYFNEDIEKAVHAPRIHHQLMPMRLSYEPGFPDEIIQGLTTIGHQMYPTPSDSGFAALTAIAKTGKTFTPVYDLRRKGSKEII